MHYNLYHAHGLTVAVSVVIMQWKNNHFVIICLHEPGGSRWQNFESLNVFEILLKLLFGLEVIALILPNIKKQLKLFVYKLTVTLWFSAGKMKILTMLWLRCGCIYRKCKSLVDKPINNK